MVIKSFSMFGSFNFLIYNILKNNSTFSIIYKFEFKLNNKFLIDRI